MAAGCSSLYSDVSHSVWTAHTAPCHRLWPTINRSSCTALVIQSPQSTNRRDQAQVRHRCRQACVRARCAWPCYDADSAARVTVRNTASNDALHTPQSRTRTATAGGACGAAAPWPGCGGLTRGSLPVISGACGALPLPSTGSAKWSGLVLPVLLVMDRPLTMAGVPGWAWPAMDRLVPQPVPVLALTAAMALKRSPSCTAVLGSSYARLPPKQDTCAAASTHTPHASLSCPLAPPSMHAWRRAKPAHPHCAKAVQVQRREDTGVCHATAKKPGVSIDQCALHLVLHPQHRRLPFQA